MWLEFFRFFFLLWLLNPNKFILTENNLNKSFSKQKTLTFLKFIFLFLFHAYYYFVGRPPFKKKNIWLFVWRSMTKLFGRHSKFFRFFFVSTFYFVNRQSKKKKVTKKRSSRYKLYSTHKIRNGSYTKKLTQKNKIKFYIHINFVETIIAMVQEIDEVLFLFLEYFFFIIIILSSFSS